VANLSTPPKGTPGFSGCRTLAAGEGAALDADGIHNPHTRAPHLVLEGRAFAGRRRACTPLSFNRSLFELRSISIRSPNPRRAIDIPPNHQRRRRGISWPAAAGKKTARGARFTFCGSELQFILRPCLWQGPKGLCSSVLDRRVGKSIKPSQLRTGKITYATPDESRRRGGFVELDLPFIRQRFEDEDGGERANHEEGGERVNLGGGKIGHG
jgi:hypothetical protein